MSQNENAKPWYKSKTIWVNLFTIVTTVGTVIVDENLLSDNPKVMAYITIAVAAANIGLRAVTSQAMSLFWAGDSVALDNET